jgi:SAM-dependent methyltransferase
MHRLPSQWAEVDDREAAMDERDARLFIDPMVVIIGTAMAEARIHLRNQVAVTRVAAEYSRNPAHGNSPSIASAMAKKARQRKRERVTFTKGRRASNPSTVGKQPISRNQKSRANIDPETVEGFGREWGTYTQSQLTGDEYDRLFDSYFHIFPFDELTPKSEGFDLGCGSGRWAAKIAPRVGLLHCIDPSREALEVARKRLGGASNVRFHLASSETIPLADDSQDFGYSLGVLHHIPDTAEALKDCVRKLKPGAPFLVYLYYSLANRPAWYRSIWRVSDLGRRTIARTPFGMRKLLTDGLAALVYWPLARTARLAERMGANVTHFPLASYRDCSFYTMRTDSLDRFGTRLEQRFSRSEVQRMMELAGLTQIRFSEQIPYWTACGRKA